MKRLLCCICLHDYVPVSLVTCLPSNTGLICRRCFIEKTTKKPKSTNHE